MAATSLVRKSGKARRLRSLSGFAVAVLLACGLALSASSPAQALDYFRASGYVQCSGGQDVVGVWVNAGSASGWANFRRVYGNQFYFDKGLGTGHPTFSVTVGCGGTGSRWGSTNYSNSMWAYVGITNYVWCGGGSCKGIGYY